MAVAYQEGRRNLFVETGYIIKEWGGLERLDNKTNAKNSWL